MTNRMSATTDKPPRYRIEAMALLVERGAHVDAEPYNGTALHWAVARKQVEAAARAALLRAQALTTVQPAARTFA